MLLWKEIIFHWRCRELAGSSNSCPWVLANPPYTLLIYKTSSLLFQLSNLFLFLGFPRAALGLSPIQSISWIFKDSVPLSYLILFLDFPLLGSCPLWLPFWLLQSMPQSSASSAGFYWQMPSKGIPPSLVLLLLPGVIWVNGPGSCPQNHWKLKFPACSVINISLAENRWLWSCSFLI